MNPFAFAQYALLLAVVIALVKPLAWYLQRVFDRQDTALDPALRPVERLIYKIAGIGPLYRPSPLNPDLAMNTAISFATTTTWQSYGGETTMSYCSQMAGLVAQDLLAGAAGLAVGIAFIRGLARQGTNGVRLS